MRFRLIGFTLLILLLLAGCTLGAGGPAPAATPTAAGNTPDSPAQGDAATPTLADTVPSAAASSPTARPVVTRTPLKATPLSATLTPWPTHTLAAGQAATITVAAQACPGAPLTRLAVGKKALVSLTPPVPSRVRGEPGLKGTFLGQIDPGEVVTILDGPRCADGYTWWKVESAKGLTGWSAEGDKSAYWLVLQP